LGQFEDFLAEVFLGGFAEGQHADDAVSGDEGEDDGLAADGGGGGQGGAGARGGAGGMAQAQAAHRGAQRGVVGGVAGGGPYAGAGGGDRLGRIDLQQERLEAVDTVL